MKKVACPFCGKKIVVPDETRRPRLCDKCYDDFYSPLWPSVHCGNHHIVRDDDGGSSWHNAIRAMEEDIYD